MVKTVLLRPSATAIVPTTVKANPGERRSARPIRGVPRRGGQPAPVEGLPHLLPRGGRIPEGPPGERVRLRQAHAPLDLPLHLTLEVRPELFLHVGAGAVGAEVAPEPEPEAMEPR